MKKGLILAGYLLGTISLFAQENKEPDTTRINIGENEVLIIKKSKGAVVLNEEGVVIDADTVDASPDDDTEKEYSNDGNWSGIDFGVTMLMNSAFQTSFPGNPQWENDPARSFYWNWNMFDRRINIYKEYVGITTGLGLNFTQIGLRNNYMLQENDTTLWAIQDTLATFTKNKLRGTYLQVPLMLEFNTHSDPEKSLHILAGVVGGVRVGSAVKRIREMNGDETKEKIKGTYGLNPFKLDAALRMGYDNWGVFASYSLLPLFDTDKTVEAYPLSFGLSFTF